MIGSDLLIDSSVWVAYFVGQSKGSREIIDSDSHAATSILSLFEVQRKFLRDGHDPAKIDTALAIMRRRGPVLELTQEICHRAATISITHDLPAMDSLIYANALHHKLMLVTADNDFRKLDGVKII